MSRHIEAAALNVRLYNWNPQFADWMLRISVLSIQFLFHGCTPFAVRLSRVTFSISGVLNVANFCTPSRQKSASKTLGAHAPSIASPPSYLQWREHSLKRGILYTPSMEARMSTLYERTGGEKAIDPGVDIFYRRGLLDDRVSCFLIRSDRRPFTCLDAEPVR
jgi:hypothetical protein